MKVITEKISFKVWSLLLIPLGAVALCRPGRQYWNESLEKCVNCSKCPEVVLRPCQIYQDTQCSSLSDLDIDWSFLGRPYSSKSSKKTYRRQHSSEEKHIESSNEGGLNDDFKFNINFEDDSRKEESKRKTNSEALSHDAHFSSEAYSDSKDLDTEEVKSHKQSHHKKWSSEEISSLFEDNITKKRYKNRQYHKKESVSETHSFSPKKHHSHSHDRTNILHRGIKWTSSEINSFGVQNDTSFSELYQNGKNKKENVETFNSTAQDHSSNRRLNTTRKHPHQHKHHHHHRTNKTESHKHHGKKHTQLAKNLEELSSDISLSRPESASQLRESEIEVNSSDDYENSRFLPNSMFDNSDEIINNYVERQKHFQDFVTPSSVSSAPFSRAEELIWDWQAVALALAVFACLLFFLVACVYSVHHARQWRRLKDNFEDFEADVGELSTRLSLLLPTLQPEEGNSITSDNNTNTSQCVYLEQLLARKQQVEEEGGNGNVYIDRDVTNGNKV